MEPSLILPGLWHGPVHWSEDFLSGAAITHVLGVGAARKDDVQDAGATLEFLPIQDDNHVLISGFLPRAVGFIWGSRASGNSAAGMLVAEESESAPARPGTRMLIGAARADEAEPDCVLAVLLEKLAENDLDDTAFDPLIQNCSIAPAATGEAEVPAGHPHGPGGPLGSCVYVHCNMGMSRSSAMVLAYLISWLPAPPVEALRILRRCREAAAPNPGFLGQLALWAADPGPTGALAVRRRLMHRFQGDHIEALHRADWAHIEQQGARISWPDPDRALRTPPIADTASQPRKKECALQ